MKKSELYHLAQIAVLNSACISPESKLEILKTLFIQEDIWVTAEAREAEKAAAEHE